MNKIVVSNIRSLLEKKRFKYFIGYKDAIKNKPFCIFLPESNAYRRDFNETKFISFLIKDYELLEKYIEIWEKIGNILKKEFDCETVCQEKYLKAKIKSYNGKIKINFHDNETPREGSQCICLSVILVNSVCKTGKNYYPQVFLEKRKYVIKNKKIPKYIIANIEISSDSDGENSDEENFSKRNSDEADFQKGNWK